jgi:hypothetical protein
MKTFFSILLLLVSVKLTSAQSLTGSVTDEKGKPIHGVFIVDTQAANAAFTDSLGNFSIFKLRFEVAGFKDTTISVDKMAPGPQIIMRTLGAVGGNSVASLSTRITQGGNDNNLSTTMADGGVIAPGHHKGKLKGSQYLFDYFVRGYLVSSSGEVLYKPDYMLDYDKVGGGLLLTTDNKTIIEVAWDNTNSFSLYSSTDERFDFEKVPSIDPSHYVQVLVSGPKYKIYKLIKTKLVKADYVNKGAVSYGNDYDEFVDDADYFVFDVQNELLQKLLLRKKSIKEVFAKEVDKASKFLANNSGSINDTYLNKLGDLMNNN